MNLHDWGYDDWIKRAAAGLLAPGLALARVTAIDRSAFLISGPDAEAHADGAHAHEPDCAVRATIHRGELDLKRLRRYQKLRKETAFHDLTYAEKRHKDKAFGKMARAVMKGKER